MNPLISWFIVICNLKTLVQDHFTHTHLIAIEYKHGIIDHKTVILLEHES